MSSTPTPRVFGTDGIRAVAGQGPLAREAVVRTGRALARFAAAHDGGRMRVLIARDPRPSGPMLVQQLAGAMAAEGAEVVDAGVLPSPALAWLTAAGAYSLGLAISASHNPAPYNGIKPFLADGRKLSSAEECQVEAWMETAAPDAPGAALQHDDDLARRYVEATTRALAREGALEGVRLAVDLSAGAAARTAPDVLRALGVDAVLLHEAGTRAINDACGTEHPEAWLETVRAGGFEGGLAFDGDADRVLVADETGALLDGDDILAILATDAHAAQGIPGGEVVSTVMANLGLEEYLATLGVALGRTPVGDRNVAERMRAIGAVLGGEPAGHVVLVRGDTGHGATLIGDGLVAGVRLLQAARRLGAPLSALRTLRPRRPQTLINVRMSARRSLDDWPAFQEAWAREERAMAGAGRFVIRYSGTEPLLRIMAEGRDAGRVRASVEALAAVARAEA